MPLSCAPRDYFPELVMEFYASYLEMKKSMVLYGLVEQFPNLPSVLVRGVEVDITPYAINSLFWDETIRRGTTFAEKIATKGSTLMGCRYHFSTPSNMGHEGR